MLTNPLRVIVMTALPAVALTACFAGGPTSKADVCASFTALDKQLLEGNGIIGNPLFHKARDLADVAGRYSGTPSLAGDAAALDKIAKSDSTSGAELTRATTHIAELCGHPLGTTILFGGN